MKCISTKYIDSINKVFMCIKWFIYYVYTGVNRGGMQRDSVPLPLMVVKKRPPFNNFSVRYSGTLKL